MASRTVNRALVPTEVRGALALFLTGVLALHVWFFATDGRTLLTWPVIALVGTLVAVPLVPHLRKFGVGSVSVVFRRASRDLQDELLRSVERLSPSGSPGRPTVAALRTVDSDPDRALSAVVALVYRALYDLLIALENASTDGVPKPSATGAPSDPDLRSVLERITAADPPEVDALAETVDRFLDSLLTARASDEVATADARELVELGAHLVTYVKLYTRLYEETALGE